MKIQIELNEIEEKDLQDCIEIIGSSTKRSCIRSVLYLFPILSKKYEVMRKENKHINKEIKMYQAREKLA